MGAITVNVPIRYGLLNLSKMNGKITINNPVVQVRPGDLKESGVYTPTIDGEFSGFPAEEVSELEAIINTDQDHKQFIVPVNGEDAGTFEGTVYLYKDNKASSLRFDGFDDRGHKIFQSGYFSIIRNIIGEIDEPEAASENKSMNGPQLMANLIEIRIIKQEISRDIAVRLMFDLLNTSKTAIGYQLFFLTNERHPQEKTDANGDGKYDFEGFIWRGHSRILGKPMGFTETIDYEIVETDGDWSTKVTKGSFNLGQVILIPE